MTETVIEINHLTKKYDMYKKPSDRLKEALSPTRKTYHEVNDFKNHYGCTNTF